MKSPEKYEKSLTLIDSFYFISRKPTLIEQKIEGIACIVKIFFGHVLLLMFVVVNFLVVVVVKKFGHVLTEIQSYLFGHVNKHLKFSDI